MKPTSLNTTIFIIWRINVTAVDFPKLACLCFNKILSYIYTFEQNRTLTKRRFFQDYCLEPNLIDFNVGTRQIWANSCIQRSSDKWRIRIKSLLRDICPSQRPPKSQNKTLPRYVLCNAVLSRRHEIKPETPQATTVPANNQTQMAIPLPTEIFD